MIAPFIRQRSPRKEFRRLAREIIGEGDFFEVYIKASFETCAERDPKGLYARENAGLVKRFSGKDSQFEEPGNEVDLIIDTESQTEAESLETLLSAIRPRIEPE